MKFDDPEVWLALGTVLAALVAGFFGQRAAGRTAQPSAQDAINAGFTALTQRQLDELRSLRKDVEDLKASRQRLADRIEEQDVRIEELEDHVEEQEDRERAFKHIIRLLLDHLDGLRQTLRAAHLPVPPDPIDRREIEKLLTDGEAAPVRTPARKER